LQNLTTKYKSSLNMIIENRAERIKAALEPLVVDLLAAGVRLNSERSMHFLFAEDYPIGLPIILSHLERPYEDLPKSIIAGALYYTKNKHSRTIWPEIASIYSKTPNMAKLFDEPALQPIPSASKSSLANALLKLYEPKRLSSLVDLVCDKGNGETRIILLKPLIRVRKRRKEVAELLTDLKSDSMLATELAAHGI
jgi:hypothetical protein